VVAAVSKDGKGSEDASRQAALVIRNVAKKKKRDEEAGLVEVPRTSDLFAPTVKLEGHKGGVHGVRFSPDGNLLASVSFGKEVFLWKVFSEADGCENYGSLVGHKNAVLQASWSADGEMLATCSADKCVRWWDCTSGKSVGFRNDHRAFVNCCDVSEMGIVASGSDDKTLRLWDPREGNRKSFACFDHDYEVTSCKFLPQGGRTTISVLYSGSVDGIIRAWDVRKRNVAFEFSDVDNCNGVITGLACAEKESVVVSHSTDGSICKWNGKFFVGAGDDERISGRFMLSDNNPCPRNRSSLLLRCDVSMLHGRVAAGFADSTVCVWDLESRSLDFRLPGHRGAVLDVHFHPKQPIIASGSLDQTIFLGELDKNFLVN